MYDHFYISVHILPLQPIKIGLKEICNLERLVISLENIFFLGLRYVTYSPFKYQSTKKIIEKIVGRRILILLVYLNILPRYRRSFKSNWIIPIFLHWFLSEINQKKETSESHILTFPLNMPHLVLVYPNLLPLVSV
jgi:hypothetical protein